MPGSQVLRSKNLATKFQILVEIAASQPNIPQKEIARRLEITPQAVSEYIRELLKEGSLTSEGRSWYRVTKEGADWLLRMARELHDYFDLVSRAVTSISVATAVADADLTRGQAVGLKMRDGLLVATSWPDRGARGVAATGASQGQDVGISNIEGLVELEPGEVAIAKVPNVQAGGSSQADLARLKQEARGKPLIGAIGIEALVALRRAGVEPGYFYGVKQAVAEAAQSGLPSLVACAEDEVPDLITTLKESGIGYRLLDLAQPPG